jgi:protein-tyrosine phosphatase
MTPEELAAEVRAAVSALPDETRLLIIDVRAADVFCRGQILGSVNICLPSTLLRRTSFGIEKLMETLKSEADLAAFNGIHQKTHIVVVDQSSERVTADMPVALLLAKFAKEGVPAKLAWLKGGFAAFSSEAPDLVVSSDPAQENGADRKPSLRLPSIAGAGAISVRPHTASTPGTRGKSVLTAPAGFFPPHGGPSSEYQTHVDSAPEELKRMKIFAKDEDLALADGVPRFLQNLLTGDEVTEKLKQKFKEIETEEQKRFQSSWRAKSPGDPFSISVGIEKGYKNRYSNIWPYNSNRVVLSGEATACDYINASFIDVPAKPRAYICTQGPIPSTFADFWLMVQETGARIVLMLTREEDHGRRQCHRYWPTKAEEVMDLGPYLSVTLVSEEQVSPHLIARKLILHHRNEPPLPVESRHVLQLQYTSWPDHGVPESAKPVIEFRDLVSCLRDRANKDAGSDVPLIVHCR